MPHIRDAFVGDGGTAKKGAILDASVDLGSDVPGAPPVLTFVLYCLSESPMRCEPGANLCATASVDIYGNKVRHPPRVSH